MTMVKQVTFYLFLLSATKRRILSSFIGEWLLSPFGDEDGFFLGLKAILGFSAFWDTDSKSMSARIYQIYDNDGIVFSVLVGF